MVSVKVLRTGRNAHWTMLGLDWTLTMFLDLDRIWCQAKFLTCEIYDFTPCAHAQINILHVQYSEKTDD